jgi:hypothetical protein
MKAVYIIVPILIIIILTSMYLLWPNNYNDNDDDIIERFQTDSELNLYIKRKIHPR